MAADPSRKKPFAFGKIPTDVEAALSPSEKEKQFKNSLLLEEVNGLCTRKRRHSPALVELCKRKYAAQESTRPIHGRHGPTREMDGPWGLSLHEEPRGMRMPDFSPTSKSAQITPSSRYRAGMILYLYTSYNGRGDRSECHNLQTRIDNDNFMCESTRGAVGGDVLVLRPWPFPIYASMGDEPPNPIDKNAPEILPFVDNDHARSLVGRGIQPTCVLETVEWSVSSLQEFSLLLEDNVFMEIIKVDHDLDYGVSIVVLATGRELILRHDKRVVVGKLSRVMSTADVLGG